MTHNEYCINVCGGKCCKVWNEEKEVLWQCPNQAKSGACNIFDEWKDKGSCGKYFPEIGNIVMNIEGALKDNLLPKWMVEQCCYAHPELLEAGL